MVIFQFAMLVYQRVPEKSSILYIGCSMKSSNPRGWPRLCSFFASLFDLSLDLCLSPAKDTGHGKDKEAESADSEKGKAEKTEKLIWDVSFHWSKWRFP